MPQNFQVDRVYPILEELNSNENYINKSNTTKYFSADLQANTLTQKKRKFVCLESSPDSTKLLVVKKYDHKSFKDSSTSDVKPINKKHLVLYVKGNEQEQCFKEMQQIVTDSFDLNLDDRIGKAISHFKGVWKNINEFGNYGDMKQAFDEKTGNYIQNSVNDLGKIYREMEEKYQQLNKNRDVSEESIKILDKMEEILDEMKNIYERNRDDFKHLSTNTVFSVTESFTSKVIAFKGLTEALGTEENNVKLKKQYQIFNDKLVAFQAEVNKPILVPCSEEVFIEKNKISEQITDLLQRSVGLKICIPSELEINGLQSKLDNLEISFSNLSDTITPESINQSTQKDIPQTKSLFKELEVLLAGIEAHKTDGNKEKLKGDLIQEIKNVLEVQDNNSIEALSKVINKTNEFIEDNKVEANAYTGGSFGKLFGKGYSVLGELMDKLQKLLDKFLNVLSLHHVNSDSNAPSMMR
ncbi:MAG: hypothetical protein WAL30_04235 [Candidatus Aquirickettsiella sp.]